MTTEHILYIPTIFFLGFLMGKLSSRASGPEEQTEPSSTRSESRRQLIPSSFVIGSFLILAVAFAATHFFELPASAKSVAKSLGGLEIFDKKPSFSSAEVYSRIGNFPETGIQLYKRFTHTIDIIFPLTLLTFLVLLSRFVTQQLFINRRWIQALHSLPFIWFGSDLLENGVVYYLLDEFPTRHNFLANSLGSITITKFTFLLISVLAPAIATIFRKKLVIPARS
ncbi:MAG: hypothetical protein ABIR06_20315 [Cyclobacteriaceae bacterium]